MTDVGGVWVQEVRRSRPRELTYFRRAPVTIWFPTPAQAEARLRFAEAARLAARLPLEEVARMVGGRPAVVNGREVVVMPGGRVLLKHQAAVAALMRGWRSEQRKVRIPEWLTELSPGYLPPPTVAAARQGIKARAQG